MSVSITNGHAILTAAALVACLSRAAMPAAADCPPHPCDEEYRQALQMSRQRGQVVRARRIAAGAIRIDGRLDEPEWHAAPVATGFTQREPDDGLPASEKTFVRVLYDDQYIYVGVTALDSEPQEITGSLARRDQYTPSDWIGIAFDSYNDRRSAFEFQVNPAGVKRDRTWFNDNECDDNWDAVWDVSTTVGSDGWTAEFRIPFSQLRYSGNGRVSVWGFQAFRQIHRRNEICHWNHLPRGSNQIVSSYGRLEGLESLPLLRNLEILPYAVAGAELYGDPGDDPFRSGPSGNLRLGGDVKYGITSDITLNATVNPDFGQVEQDPSEFNLTAHETYFDEKRPFFIEGAGIFNSSIGIGDDSRERLFYSRRIGRAPQFHPLDSSRWPETGDFWHSTPRFARILGAAKITGRTANGWSIGLLEALTARENAAVEAPGGERYGVAVEPMTNYGVLSIQKDFNAGRSTLGGIATSVNRELPNEDLLDLNSGAYSGGVNFSHRWKDDRYQVMGNLYASHIRGSEQAILRAQTAPLRYYQRPDAGHLGVDSTLTSLSGFTATLMGGKVGGEPWRWGTGLHLRSPGLETNDIGFQQEADAVFQFLWIGYRNFEPGRILRSYSINSNFWTVSNFGGDNLDRPGGNINAWFQAKNYWSLYWGASRNQQRRNNGILRGGPSMLVPGTWFLWSGFQTDTRGSIVLGCDGNWSGDDEGFAAWSIRPGVTIRPSGRFDFGIYPSYRSGVDDRQYVGENGGEYILARLERQTLGITARLNLALTPEMTLQFYGMPYITAGRYSDFRSVTSPRAPRYADRFTPCDHPDNIDFNFKQLRTNLIYRWEFSPGSALFLVWSHGTTDYESEYGAFSPGRDLERLFSAAGDNTILIKISRWFTL